ncbi:GNAT family N-acetyltransferase [Lacticaseibacillus paracasei]|uniref:GNAT family N-acetyltransferase n=1 Tax=Lacticaseibacillus paracasei TaxID=1597 RepID=UPI00209CF2C2|nr:GNAT family N-acetyltransferase [Lacticaseibacillus paracasei]UVH23863.1 GNAT family N-acetyltransferase [Lacticaseibacillus paracasei]
MIIRSYQPSDAAPTLALFRDTVQKINAKDYTADQIAVWAGHERSLAVWHASFIKHVALVAVDEAEIIIGFADMVSDGYLDRLYVSAAHQREGVGKRLVAALEQRVVSSQYTASWIIHLGIGDMKSHLAGLKATFGALRILTERRSW